MTIHYPNGKSYHNIASNKTKKQLQANADKAKKSAVFGNRGMKLEDDINQSNQYYLTRGKAVIHKKPTPIQVVQVDYPNKQAAIIKEAYFSQASTTDYNGIYRGIYLDFEAKETKLKTSFPLKNFHEHQIRHMENCEKQAGFCFVILGFSALNKVYLLPFKALHPFWLQQEKKQSIPLKEIEAQAVEIKYGYAPRLDYLAAIDLLLQDQLNKGVVK